jgi:ribose 5-phosphate isomerase B
MRVYLGSDHAGFELKTYLVEHVTAAGHEAVDCGPAAYDPEDDYPPYCFAVGERVLADPGSLGVVIGGSGNGEQIAANKVPGVRAALAWSEETARLAREHNDAHVVAVGARMHSPEEAARFVDVFVGTAFSGGGRHARRLRLLADYEASH